MSKFNPSHLKVFNFNASRISSLRRMRSVQSIFESFDSDIISIQEIDINGAITIFSSKYHVFVNPGDNSSDGIGIVTLVRKKFIVEDFVVGGQGRILGVRLGDLQFWNVYPKSGTNNKSVREKFLRETLLDHLSLWSGRTRFTLIGGDFNCTNRLIDSLNHQQVHYSPGLVYLMSELNLKDDFVRLHNNRVEFSRVSGGSSTRIDFIISNAADTCQVFEYKVLGGFDHKAVYAEYSISVGTARAEVPRERRFDHFVFSRELEKDVDFINGAKTLIDSVSSNRQGFADITEAWKTLKDCLKVWAKSRTRSIKTLRNAEKKVLVNQYHSIMEMFHKGEASQESVKEWRRRFEEFIQDDITRMIDDNKVRVIKNQHYDIQKDQKKFKFGDNGRIEKLSIEGKIYEGTEEIVAGVHKAMSEELASFGSLAENADVSEEEKHFLDYIEELTLSNEDLLELTKPIEAEEIETVFTTVDPDSSPGEDGITYRMLKSFWQFESFQSLYLDFVNFVKDNGSFGHVGNLGIMILKNKKGNSIGYQAKRKITKLNKDSNLGLGKVWVNRFMAVLSDRVIPETQFLCRTDTNIVDELRDLRNINLHLKGVNGREIDGSLISIDFKNAFRSLSWRWIWLVMKKFGIPVQFITWLKAMYDQLGISIVINGWKSDPISNDRGLLEGHSPSMQIYCMSSGPLLRALDRKLSGIRTWDGILHKNKSFADDLKLALRDPGEISCVDETIQRFEGVSGLILHRDVSRKKCNVLTFGSHRKFDGWPPWVNKVSKTKIIGAVFSNLDDIEHLNSMEVQRSALARIHGSLGLRGTLLQKAYFLNTFVFSKLTYLAQVFKINEGVIKIIMRESLRFIYRGEWERPVNSINYRPKELLGLGLVHLPSKCKSLIMRTMLREFQAKQIRLLNGDFTEYLYGHKAELINLIGMGDEIPSAKELYLHYLNDVLYKRGCLIPSRMEKKYEFVEWENVFRNYSEAKYLKPKQRELLFRFCHDLLHLGARNHFRGADKVCKREESEGIKCTTVETRIHFFKNCLSIIDMYCSITMILEAVMQKEINEESFFTMAFQCPDRDLNRVAVWFLVQVLDCTYNGGQVDPVYILESVIKEIDWLRQKCNKKFEEALLNLRIEITMQITSFKYDL